MGPAYIPFVKTNFALDNPKNYDAKFVAGEVNAVHRFPKSDYRHDVGRAMLTKKAFAMQPLDIIRRYKMCNSMFFVVKNHGKSCSFPIANGKFGRLHNGHGSGESKPRITLYTKRAVTKSLYYHLFRRRKHWFAIMNRAQMRGRSSISKICVRLAVKWLRAFWKWDHTIDVPVADDETDVDNKDEAEGGSDDESDAGEEGR